MYPIVFFDAIVVKVRETGRVAKRSIYMALAINLEGKKELLGLWLGESEGAKYWLGIMTELKNRGVQDILIAAVDGLTGFPDALQHRLSGHRCAAVRLSTLGGAPWCEARSSSFPTKIVRRWPPD